MTSGNGGVLVQGYASVFGEADQNGDVVQRGAFYQLHSNRGKSIPAQSSHVMMLYQHTVEKPIGRWVEIVEDSKGLKVSGIISMATTTGQEAASLVREGIINGLSIGFKTKAATRLRGGGRLMKAIELWEISIVTFPMARNARIHSVKEVSMDRMPINLFA